MFSTFWAAIARISAVVAVPVELVRVGLRGTVVSVVADGVDVSVERALAGVADPVGICIRLIRVRERVAVVGLVADQVGVAIFAARPFAAVDAIGVAIRVRVGSVTRHDAHAP